MKLVEEDTAKEYSAWARKQEKTGVIPLVRIVEVWGHGNG